MRRSIGVFHRLSNQSAGGPRRPTFVPLWDCRVNVFDPAVFEDAECDHRNPSCRLLGSETVVASFAVLRHRVYGGLEGIRRTLLRCIYLNQ
jgi:hypothetical protein